MSNPFADTLHLRVRASAAYRGFNASLHGVAMIVIAILALGRPVFVLLLPVVGVFGWYVDRDARLARRYSIVRLRWQAEGVWRWQTRDGMWHRGQLAGSFTAGSWLVVLRLRPDHHRLLTRSCVLFRDALPGPTHRRLRARLTIAPTPGLADRS